MTLLVLAVKAGEKGREKVDLFSGWNICKIPERYSTLISPK
jgi:hypothetical protein